METQDLRYVGQLKVQRSLAQELQAFGHQVSQRTVCRMLIGSWDTAYNLIVKRKKGRTIQTGIPSSSRLAKR